MEEEERRASKEDKTSNHISKPYDSPYLRNTVTVHQYCRVQFNVQLLIGCNIMIINKSIDLHPE
jgi:hypothetical protein